MDPKIMEMAVKLKGASESDLQKLLQRVNFQLMVYEGREDTPKEVIGNLLAQDGVISAEIDRRHPLVEPARIIKA